MSSETELVRKFLLGGLNGDTADHPFVARGLGALANPATLEAWCRLSFGHGLTGLRGRLVDAALSRVNWFTLYREFSNWKPAPAGNEGAT